MAARRQLYAREGAKVMVVDYRLNSAEDTCQMIAEEGGVAIALEADATKSDDCQKVADVCVQRFGRIDILHNNVGIGDNDGGLDQVTEEAWDRILAVNIKSVIMPCKLVYRAFFEPGVSGGWDAALPRPNSKLSGRLAFVDKWTLVQAGYLKG
jgi:NAD(P)-dependent dehydrogenase (short-subunit alcohol dehydrogenase family)